jgi:hypothetical protein
MSLKPNPKEINIILNILKGAQFEFFPRAPFYIDTPLALEVRGDTATEYGGSFSSKSEDRPLLYSSVDVLGVAAHPVTLVLDVGELLVIAQCYQGHYSTPYHDHEVFILGRTTRRHLLDHTLNKLASSGMDTRHTQVLLWSMCPNL